MEPTTAVPGSLPGAAQRAQQQRRSEQLKHGWGGGKKEEEEEEAEGEAEGEEEKESEMLFQNGVKRRGCRGAAEQGSPALHLWHPALSLPPESPPLLPLTLSPSTASIIFP